MARGVAYGVDVRAAASAALIAGEAVGDVAADLALPGQTVSDWSRADSLAEVRAKKASEFEGLLSEYLRETLLTLTAQTRVMRDEAWLRKQNANGIAILHGVTCDKVLRILDAAARAAERGSADQPARVSG